MQFIVYFLRKYFRFDNRSRNINTVRQVAMYLISQTYLSKALHFKSNALRPYEVGKRKLSYEISRSIMEFFQQRAEEMRSGAETVKK